VSNKKILSLAGNRAMQFVYENNRAVQGDIELRCKHSAVSNLYPNQKAAGFKMSKFSFFAKRPLWQGVSGDEAHYIQPQKKVAILYFINMIQTKK
jgi:hypothetical protein